MPFNVRARRAPALPALRAPAFAFAHISALSLFPRLSANSTYNTRFAPVQGGAAPAASNDHAGHAFLHDFCMTIPYGAILAAAGVIGLVAGWSSVGAGILAAGVAVCLSSYVSLQEWKQGQSSALYTLSSGAVASGVGWLMYKNVQAKAAVLPSGILLALSAAAALFCFYNVAAGGNPPKKKVT